MKKQNISVIIVSVLLGGCSTLQPPLRQMAVDSNRLVADSANQQTLMNILRSKDRLPMHFSSFRYIRGNLQVSTSAGIGGSLVERGTQVLNETTNTPDGTTTKASNTLSNGVDTFSPTVSASIMSNPNFEMAIFDTKEFQQGILKPVSPSLIEYYLQQGWPEDLLTALFVSRVDIKVMPIVDSDDSDSPSNNIPVFSYSLKNEPIVKTGGMSGNFGKFIEFFEMIPVTSSRDDKKLLKLTEFNDNVKLADIEKLDGKSFDIVSSKEEKNGQQDENTEIYVSRIGGSSRGISYRIRGETNQNAVSKDVPANTGLELALENIYSSDEIMGKFVETRLVDGNQKIIDKFNLAGIGSPTGPKFRVECSASDIAIFKEANKDDKFECHLQLKEVVTGQYQKLGKLNINVYLRSPESIMYFLGNYARDYACLYGNKQPDASNAASDVTKTECSGRIYKLPGNEIIIYIDDQQISDSLVTVKYRGKYHSINAPKYVNGAPNHRGSQSMVLAQQLINLHKSADKLPATIATQIVP